MSDIDIPLEISTKMEATRKMLADYEASLVLEKKYPALRRRLEALVESKKEEEGDETISVKDQRAIQYFETCKQQIEEKLASVDRQYEKLIAQMEAQRDEQKAKLKEKLFFVENRLTSASQRADKKKKNKKSKEQLSLEIEIQELVETYSKLQPKADLLKVFPGIQETGISIPDVSPPAPIYSPSPADKPSPPPEKKPAIKRRVKTVSPPEPSAVVEEPEPAPQPAPVEEPFQPVVAESLSDEKKHFLKIVESLSPDERQTLFQARPDIKASFSVPKSSPPSQPKIIQNTRR